MKLVFVYNTRLTAKSLMHDFINEVLPTRKASCNLCDITYSLAWKKREWKEFLNKLSIAHAFYFIEEFESTHPNYTGLKYPCILIESPKSKKLITLMSKQEIDLTEDLEQLITLITSKLDNYRHGE